MVQRQFAAHAVRNFAQSLMDDMVMVKLDFKNVFILS